MNDELDIFMGIVKSYDLTIPSLKRKYDHTFRVVDYASNINYIPMLYITCL